MGTLANMTPTTKSSDDETVVSNDEPTPATAEEVAHASLANLNVSIGGVDFVDADNKATPAGEHVKTSQRL